MLHGCYSNRKRKLLFIVYFFWQFFINLVRSIYPFPIDFDGKFVVFSCNTSSGSEAASASCDIAFMECCCNGGLKLFMLI